MKLISSAKSSAKSSATRLCDRIRLARNEAKLSQTALAERVGVTASAVAQWESHNGTRPGTERLQDIAAATGATFEWLATGHGSKQRRSRTRDEETPAVSLGSFARDAHEELLLERFRRLPRRAQEAFCSLIVEITSKPR
ncbi:MAG: helix-turn-helix transcriptional regulator [Rudaea sp.]|nr:helix-turn-helix transcriptional regulator [Rudaea sp.]